MSDQEVIETSRYARKTVKVRGLCKGSHDPMAKAIIAKNGIMWDLSNKTDDLEVTTQITRKVLFNGEEAPGTLSSREEEWLEGFCERNGIDIGITETEYERVPDVPYISAYLRFSMGGDDWSEIEQDDAQGHAKLKAQLCRMSGVLTLTIEGSSKDAVANPGIDEWIEGTVRHVRESLKLANFHESESLDIDCEVIMGAEREAKCDPNLMRSLLADNNAEDEEVDFDPNDIDDNRIFLDDLGQLGDEEE